MTNKTKAIIYTAGIVVVVPAAVTLSTLLTSHYPKETMIAFGIGIAGWSMFHYLNKANKPVADTKPVSKHIGKVGEKITVVGTITAVKYVSCGWGRPRSFSTFLTVTDNDGNIAKTFLSGAKGDTLQVGQAITMTGKVKKLEDFKGQLSTMLNYVKL